MALSGGLTILVPEVRAQSLTLTILPASITFVLGFLGLVGGSLCAYGIWKANPRFEGAGFSALMATQIAALLSSIVALGFVPSVLGVLLRGGLAAGCGWRAYNLARLS